MRSLKARALTTILVVVLSSCWSVSRLAWAQQLLLQDQQQQLDVAKPPITLTGGAVADAGASAGAVVASAAVGGDDKFRQDELRRFEDFKRSPLYVEPFDPKVISVPDVQLAFIRNMSRNDIILFRQILDEAIANRNTFMPSVKLMFKYTGRLLTNFIRNRLSEQRLPARVEPKPEFFGVLADVAQQVVDRSGSIKREKGYSKSTVDVAEFRSRVDGIFNYIQRILDTSPMGAYLKWNQLTLYNDEPKNPRHRSNFIEEIADLVAQFRSIGYESAIFVARRIISMLRMFSRGIVPESESQI